MHVASGKVAHWCTTCQLLPSKWVYTLKRNGLYKTSVVVRRDKQQPGDEFEDTFTSVVSPETFWTIIMALVSSHYLESHASDVVPEN